MRDEPAASRFELMLRRDRIVPWPFMMLRQIMPIASSLAGGLALSSLGMLSRAASRGASLGGTAGMKAGKAAVGFMITGLSRRAQTGAPATAISWRDR